MTILFNCRAAKNGPEFCEMLCKVLEENQDFINSNIVVSNVDTHLVGLYISPKCKSDSMVIINLEGEAKVV